MPGAQARGKPCFPRGPPSSSLRLHNRSEPPAGPSPASAANACGIDGFACVHSLMAIEHSQRRRHVAADCGNATRDPDAFTRTAIKLEDLAVAGYNGQATNLSRAALGAAATIVSVEARHAAWIRAIAGQVAAPDPVDKPATAAEVE